MCATYKRNFEEAQAWYDGYELVAMDGENPKIYSMYSPKSVVDAMLSGLYDNYWNQTETYEALKIYIQMNFDGLKDAIVRMLAGDRVEINTGTFSNDMTTFQNRDDVLTLLVHLGYLSYHWMDKTVSIPNKEVSQEYVNAISTMDWHEVIDSVEASKICWKRYGCRTKRQWQQALIKRIVRFPFCSTTMKIRWHVRSIWRFILHGNTTRS